MYVVAQSRKYGACPALLVHYLPIQQGKGLQGPTILSLTVFQWIAVYCTQYWKVLWGLLMTKTKQLWRHLLFRSSGLSAIGKVLARRPLQDYFGYNYSTLLQDCSFKFRLYRVLTLTRKRFFCPAHAVIGLLQVYTRAHVQCGDIVHCEAPGYSSVCVRSNKHNQRFFSPFHLTITMTGRQLWLTMTAFSPGTMDSV